MKGRFLTLFPNVGATTKSEVNLTDEGVDKLLKGPVADDKHDLPMISLQQFGDYAHPGSGSLKTDRNAHFSYGIIADYDGERLAPEEIVEKLQRAPIEAKVKTTASHWPDAPRCHILCWYSEPRSIDREFHRRMLARLNGALGGGVLSTESLPLSQGFFNGMVRDGHPVEIYDSEGFPIDTLDDLDEIASYEFVSKSKAKAADSNGNGPKLDKEALLAQIRSGEHFYQPTLSLAGILAFEGVPLLDARKLLEDAFDAAEPPNDYQHRKEHRKWNSNRAAIGERLLLIYGKQAARDEAKLNEREAGLDGLDERSPKYPGAVGFQPRREADDSDLPDIDSAPEDSPGDRTAQAQQHWGSAPSFRDPWVDPPRPEWPGDVLPPAYNDMLYLLAESDGVDPGALGLAVLAAVSGAANKASKFWPYGTHLRFRVPPIVWCFVDAPSGQRKTATGSPFAQFHRHNATVWEQYERDREAWEGLDRKARKVVPEPQTPANAICVDSTAEKVMRVLHRSKRGTLVLRDELAAFFGFGRYNKDKGAAERAFYLEGYEGNPYTVQRVTQPSFHIHVNGITVFGFIQPERLAGFHDLDADGLLQRFFPIRARAARVSRDLGAIPAKGDFDHALDLLMAMPERQFLATSDGTAIIRKMEVDAVDFATFSDLGTAFMGLAGKLHGSLARVALLLHLLDKPHDIQTEIPAGTIARADKLMREFVIPHACDVHASLAPEKIERTKDIAAWLLTKAPLSIRASDIGKNVRSCHGLTDPVELNKALEPLTAGGWLEPETQFPSNRKWRLDPRVRGELAHRTAQARDRREQMRQLWERIGAEKPA
jgi:hypothetical protein